MKGLQGGGGGSEERGRDEERRWEEREKKKYCHENLTSQPIRTHFVVIIKQMLLLALLQTAMEDALRSWCLKQVSKDERNEHWRIQAKWI